MQADQSPTLAQRALELVESCIDLSPTDRQRCLDEACADEPDLRASVERMLAMEKTRFRFLDTEAPSDEADEFLPERIGPWRIGPVIARGGMGTVVKAERDDGVYQQTVAIKLIRAGLRDARAEERFALERRILARLSHPGIARILDGGEVDGRPYLLMEYVEGEPMTTFIAKRRAGLAETLATFETVCEAVSHAHRNLVVHADIKPPNVLATPDGTVKLVDFGIARLTAELGEEVQGPYPLTRGYAAPERLAGEPPTVACDVFSLGALLHEMLTGVLPDPGGRPMSALDTDARIDRSRLAGDLDAIVAQALAPEREDRYPDVASLVQDLRRYHNRLPVAARPAGWRYRTGRFIARHRRGLAVTALVMLALVGAVVATTTMYFRAERARAEAETRFQEVRSLARFMLFDLYDELRSAPGTVKARVAIANTGRRYLDRLRQVPDAPADLRLDSAMGYRRLATVQGMSGTASLGESTNAVRSLGAADALVRSVLAEQPANAAALEEMGWIMASRWVMAPGDGGVPNREARRYFAAALAREPGRLGATLGTLTTQRNEAYDLIFGDRPREAIPLLRQALEQLRRVRWSEAEAGDALLLEVNLLNRLGDATYYAGSPAGALPIYREADGIVARQLASGESAQWLDRRGETMWNISGTLNDLGRPGEALEPARTGIAAILRLLQYGPDSNAEKRLLILYAQEGHILADLGRPQEAAAASRRSAAMREARLAREPNDLQRVRDLAVHLPSHADMLARVGDANGACGSARRALNLWERMRRQGQLAAFDARAEVAAAETARRRYCRG